MRPLRLLVVAQPLDSGVARHVVTLVEALPSERFAVDVACPPSSLTWRSLNEREGVRLHAIGSHRRPAPGDLRSLYVLLRLVPRADVVHVHSSKAGFLGRLASRIRGRAGACVFTPHAWSFWSAGAEAELYAGLERLAARWCAAIVALSQEERAAGLAKGIGRAEQYRVIPNGILLGRFSAPPRPISGRILMVGRLARQKRPDVALRAVASLRERLPQAELWIVGDGPLRAESERLAVELGIDQAVHFLGDRDDVPALLAETECALLASDYEGCPLAVIEAMAAGVPVAATDVGATAELVRPGLTGTLAPRGDPEGLAAALAEIMTDPQRAAEFGAEGRRVASAEYSASRMVERLAVLYEGLAER